MARTRQVVDSRADAAEPAGSSDGWGRRTEDEGNCVGRGNDVRLGGGESRLVGTNIQESRSMSNHNLRRELEASAYNNHHEEPPRYNSRPNNYQCENSQTYHSGNRRDDNRRGNRHHYNDHRYRDSRHYNRDGDYRSRGRHHGDREFHHSRGHYNRQQRRDDRDFHSPRRSNHRDYLPRSRDSHYSRSDRRSNQPNRPKHEPSINEMEQQRQKQSLELELIRQEKKIKEEELQVIEKEIKIAEQKKLLEAVKQQPVAAAASREDTDVATKSSSTASASTANPNAVAAASNMATSYNGNDDPLFDTALIDSDDKLDDTKRTKRAGSKRTKKPNTRKTKKKAKSKKTVFRWYTEDILKSTYSPSIIDHHQRNKKLLVKWNKTDSSESLCNSWVKSKDFVFPCCAKEYIAALMNSTKCRDDKKSLGEWKRVFEQTEIDEQRKNTINDWDDKEGSDLEEIDFCCFLCSCEGDNDCILDSLRNCPETRRYHRACCHEYKTVEDLEGFISRAGQAYKDLLDQVENGETSEMPEVSAVGRDLMSSAETNEMPDEDSATESTKPSAVTVRSGESVNQLTGTRSAAVILSINTGIGCVAVATKQLGLNVRTIIHVEDDPVTRHAIRFHHDSEYGNTSLDDGIEHIVGLYNDLDELMDDPSDIVKRFGPVDLIICASNGQTESEHKKYTECFFSFCENIRRHNKELKQHDLLLYLIETLPLPHGFSDRQSFCICDSRSCGDGKRELICNWSLGGEISSLKELGALLPPADTTDLSKFEDTLGVSDQYVASSVTDLFNQLKTAFTVGFGGIKWSDNVHPKYWEFLSLGPFGHNFKTNSDPQSDGGFDSMILEIREPMGFELLCDKEYAMAIMKRSMSVRWLVAMLKPLLNYFGNKQYIGYTGLRALVQVNDVNHELQDNSNDTRVKVDGEESTDEEKFPDDFIDYKPLHFDL